MKSIFVVLGVVLMMSLAFAAIDGPAVHEPRMGIESPELTDVAQGSYNASHVANAGDVQKIQVQAGEHVGENGESMMVRTEANNQIRLEIGGNSAKSSMKIDQKSVNGTTRLSAKLSNGRNAEIKIMPDVASEVALERLRLKNCVEESGCSIELKEVGAGDDAKLAYEVQAERHSKLLGLFSAKMQVRAQVDAENGEVLSVNKPWWAFLATEPTEE